MFRKNKQQPPQQNSGRQRPVISSSGDRPTSAVFSYHTASRTARPSTGNPNRDMKAIQKEAKETSLAVRGTKHVNWKVRGPVTAALVVVGIVLLSSLFVGSQPVIVQEGDGRGQIFLRSMSVYQQATATLLNKSVLNHFKPTINTTSIAQQLNDEFPELTGVAITVTPFGRQPIVHIQPATPALILSESNGSSYVVDTTGLALITATQAPGVDSLHLPVVTDQSGLTFTPGQLALPATSTSFITEVVGQVQAAGLTISSLTLPKGTAELDLRVSGVPYYIKFNLEGTARVEAGTFLAVKAQLQKENVTPSTYLDVRVEGRAYYK